MNGPATVRTVINRIKRENRGHSKKNINFSTGFPSKHEHIFSKLNLRKF